MAIKKDNDNDNQLSKLDDDNESNLVYHNSENKVRFDLEVVANNEENEDEIEKKVYLDLKVKAIVAQPASQHQIRSDINTQISVIFIDRCEYFKCNICLQ